MVDAKRICQARECRGATRPALLVIALLVGAPGLVSAQLAAGRRALEQADFQRALRAFDRAERTEALDRDGLVALAEGRVLARYALGSPARARGDLEVLAALDPNHEFPPEAPPEVLEAFAAVREAMGGGLGGDIRFEREGRALAVGVEVRNDRRGLVRTVRLRWRVGEGPWEQRDSNRVVLEDVDGSVSAWAELLGARDVVLLTLGSEDAPRIHRAAVEAQVSAQVALEARDEPSHLAPTAQHDDSTDLLVGLGIGGGIALAVGFVVLGVVLGTSSSSETLPMTPMVTWELR